jgi:hypothetical protein
MTVFTRHTYLTFMLTSLCIVSIGCVVDNPEVIDVDMERDATNISSMNDSQVVADDMDITTETDGAVTPDTQIDTDEGVDAVDQMLSSPDMLVADARPIPDMMPPPPPVECGIEIAFDQPVAESFHRQGSPLDIIGHVLGADGTPMVGATVNLIEANTNLFATVQTDAQGRFVSDSSQVQLRPGQKQIRAQVSIDEQTCLETGSTNLFFCRSVIDEDFSALPEEWSLYRDAGWNPGGWLEMTGTSQGRKGAVYNTVDAIASGVASIQFTLTTGGGINGGADGFAFTIVEIADSTRLLDLLNGAGAGGGLGYGVGGAYADPDFVLTGDALTVEIDTWHNQLNNVERHTDPTNVNHIAITQNADAGDHLAWFEVPDVEDLQPHIVRVDLTGNLMRITYDGAIIIEQPVVFSFKGGYMFFSGSTGWATNFHRFDDLQILHNCQ